MLGKNKLISIAVNDELLSEAQALSQIKSKRKLIELVLREFVAKHKRMDLRELKGLYQLGTDYDYKNSR